MWNDKSFQYHYFSQAQNILSAFHTLSDISYERPYLRKEGLIKNVIKTLTNYLPVYIKKKRRIPRKSRWYQEVLSHKDWYLSDYTSIALATQTSTQLRPTPKTDNEWFEREVFQLTEKALRRFVDDRNVEGVVAILELLRKAYRGLGSDWLVGFAKQSLIDLSSVVISIQTEDQKLTNNEELLRLQMLSDLLVLPIDTLLGCFATVGTIKIDEIRIHLEGFDWNKPEELYTFNIPANTLDGIEDLAPRIQFEIEAEGKIITPNWFALQAIIVSINLTLHEEVKHLEELGHNFFLNLASKLLEQDQPMMAMLTISNGLQFLDKFYVHMNTLKGFVNEMNLVRHFSSMRWVEWDWDSIYTEAKATEKKLGERVAQSISEMVKRNPNSTDEIPDFLGEALNIVGNQYFQALYENDLEHATSLFEPLFKGNLTKYNALLPRLFELKVDFSRFILSSSEPISDLLELSGYAYLFSKYHNNPALWEHCKEVWREYANGGDAQTQIKSILSIVSTARKEIGFGSRYQTRSVWRQHFMSKLRELDYAVYDDPHGSIVPRSICNHPDIVIRTLAPKERYSLDINDDIAMSVFAELYLYDIVGAKEGDYRFEEIKNRIVWQQEDEKATGFVPTTDE